MNRNVRRASSLCMRAASGFLLLAASLLAHHGSSAYNTSEPYTVTGTVVEFQFLNPHCIITLETKDDSGAVQKWQGELTSPNRLIHDGWNSQSIKPGDKVTLTGWRAKSGSNSLWITKTVLNGEELKTGAGN
jgi:DNA/RNA endonuclease YhcR with UshA esterase domain